MIIFLQIQLQRNKFTFTLCPPNSNLQCVLAENIHTQIQWAKNVIGNFSGEGWSQKPKFLKESMNQNWNFKRDGKRGRDSNQTTLYGRGTDIFWHPINHLRERQGVRLLLRVLRLQQSDYFTYASRCQCLQTCAHFTTVFLRRNWKIERIISSDNNIQ